MIDLSEFMEYDKSLLGKMGEQKEIQKE